MAKAIAVDEKEWQAESDARTLATADEIKKDKKRLKAAVLKARKLADEAANEAGRLKKVAKLKKGSKSPIRKKATQKNKPRKQNSSVKHKKPPNKKRRK